MRRADTAKNRKHILEMAEAVFAELGYAGSSIKEIAGRATVPLEASRHVHLLLAEDLLT